MYWLNLPYILIEYFQELRKKKVEYLIVLDKNQKYRNSLKVHNKIFFVF